MRFVFLSLLFILSLQTKIALGSTAAEGTFFYKNANNEIEFVDSKLMHEVIDGQHIIKIWCPKHGEVTATKYFARQQSERTIFYVVLPAMDNNPSIVLKGTYTRGLNIALYYGDAFFVSENQSNFQNFEEIEAFSHDAAYIGGFAYQAFPESK